MGSIRTLRLALTLGALWPALAAAQIFPYVDTTGSSAGQVFTSNGAGVKPTFQAAGGGASPGGADRQLQFNNAGAFGGATLKYVVCNGFPCFRFSALGGNGPVIDTDSGVDLTIFGGNTDTDNTTSFLGLSAGGGLSGNGGGMTLAGGNAFTAGTGGSVNMFAGDGRGAAFSGGDVGIFAGNAGASGAGGSLTLNAGAAAGAGESGGTINLSAGTPGAGGGGGSVCTNTNSVNRICITPAGDWLIGGLAGTTGQVATSNGLGAPPTWQSVSLSGTSGNIGGGALAAGACASGTVAVTDSTTAMVAAASPVTYPGDGAVWSAQVTAAGTVTVRVCAIVALTPIASAYNVRVLR